MCMCNIWTTTTTKKQMFAWPCIIRAPIAAASEPLGILCSSFDLFRMHLTGLPYWFSQCFCSMCVRVCVFAHTYITWSVLLTCNRNTEHSFIQSHVNSIVELEWTKKTCFLLHQLQLQRTQTSDIVSCFIGLHSHTFYVILLIKRRNSISIHDHCVRAYLNTSTHHRPFWIKKIK